MAAALKSGRKGLKQVKGEDSESDSEDEANNIAESPPTQSQSNTLQGRPKLPIAGMAAALKSGRKGLKQVKGEDSESDSEDEAKKFVESSPAHPRPNIPQGRPKLPIAGMAAALKSGRKGLKQVKGEDSESDSEGNG